MRALTKRVRSASAPASSSVTAVNPQAAMAATIDSDVPSKKALTSTITAAPVQSCSVPISAEAVPA